MTTKPAPGRPREPLFFCAALDGANEVALTGEEATHVKAHRLQLGDSVTLFGGRGNVVRGTVRSTTRAEVQVSVSERWHEPPPLPGINLCCAVPKGDRMATLLDMATQLGMTRFTPIRWARSVVEPSERAADRWRRICLEACKQSRRLYVPEIGSASTPTDAVAKAQADGARLILAHPQADTARQSTSQSGAGPTQIALFVGPEGGLMDAELSLLRDASADFWNLGRGILRIETAAIALIATVSTARLLGRN